MNCCCCGYRTCPTCGGDGVVPVWPWQMTPWPYPWPYRRPRRIVPMIPPMPPRFSQGAARDRALATR